MAHSRLDGQHAIDTNRCTRPMIPIGTKEQTRNGWNAIRGWDINASTYGAALGRARSLRHERGEANNERTQAARRQGGGEV
ncbi:hypothetical protein P170DRAFT_434595 [Aspergillus steynii IBT 23096]|uniref:Uncharacterized protein n=1 Tax=Aspergillus steynii IBT 23096 TaxID=1392250 RepID=A0A2I2GJ20_9EURO|nr:uncharacterized protein P170DRAFT_434595 [Aspergillus steynii IBT 23096]PLB52868.1 hypothetical protein P170DRAFT_434595 [Aspergillus steynii IBT 23096]